jgi:hypothetical protein
MRREAAYPVRTALVLTLVATAPAAMQGCHKPLFPPDQPRTQFETYDRMRNRWIPREEPDVFGNPQPALRARLSQPR